MADASSSPQHWVTLQTILNYKNVYFMFFLAFSGLLNPFPQTAIGQSLFIN